MIDRDHIARLLAQRREGFSLPQGFYLDEAMHEADVRAVFETEWLFACNACEIKKPGDYLTLEVGSNPVVILRDRDGQVRAFHNSCRHRGSRICGKEKGRATRLVCPYHQWVYELDGSLLNARQMPADFDRSDYGLKPAHVEVICGMIYLCLAETPPDLSRFRQAITPFIAPHQPDRTKVAFEMTLIEEANWKLIIENNRECYHCAANHPELLASLVEFALPDDPLGPAQFQELIARKTAKWDALGLPHAPADGGDEFRCIRLPFHEGALSFTMDGGPACTKLLGDFTDPDLGSVRMFRAPNNWNHFLADNIIHFRVLPLSAGRTSLRTTWLVHEDAVEGVDYDVNRLTEVWIATNEQDSDLASVNQRGIRSMAYRPGPYAPSEFMLTHFTNWYARQMEAFAGAPAPLRVAAE
ncbi:aromatic ring-hydroxylating dioxygenase subunit alpha [Bosea vestrisii]|uniref:aromatic ring-hydroxylating oxygenase subunit alpha n=1 Tax=Bosea vestrisii TaxID=151416 RepID=UPI0024DFEF08|nr:aromatic ring-hydroxylating dioxygenase subunit alpha [Bosea vestrisii]WID96636.1 aromatic ring-hydroxylating dioxygenase subunit alpha [Bosea vestrisii]